MKLFIPIIFAASLGATGFSQEGGAPIKVTTTLHSDGTQTVLKTDPDAHTAESNLVDSAQKLIQRTVYAMDDQGQFTNSSIYDGKGNLLFKSVYVRDANNRLTEQLNSSAEDKLLNKLRFEYDKAGKLIRVRTFDPAGNETTPAGNPNQEPKRRR